MTTAEVAFNALVDEAKANLRKPRRADLTQLGDARAKLSQSGRLVLPAAIRCSGLGTAVASALGFDVKAGVYAELVVSFADSKHSPIAPELLAGVAATIAPKREPEVKEVLADRVFSAAVGDAERKSGYNAGLVQAHLARLNWDDDSVRAKYAGFVSVGGVAEDGKGAWGLDWGTVMGDIRTFVDSILMMRNGFPDEVKEAADSWMFHVLISVNDVRAQITTAYQKAYEITRNVIVSGARQPTATIQGHIVDGNDNFFKTAKVALLAAADGDKEKVQAAAALGRVEGSKEYDVTPIAGADAEGLAEFAYFCMARGQLSSGTSDVKDMFAEVRTAGVRLNLQCGSDEVVSTVKTIETKVDTEAIRAWTAYSERPERAEVILSGAVISFLECGHHCTAQNLASKMESIARAINYVLPRSTWETYVLPGCWAATHPFSVRLMYARLLALAAKGNLTFAITKRLNKHAPGTGPFILLGEVLDALNEAGFFRLVNRTVEYRRAKEAVARIRLNNHLKAPYSHYMYGESVGEDTEDKAYLMKLASLAASLRDSMPGSTIASSRAFERLTSSAAANSIVGGMQVRAFVRAVATQAERDIAKRITSDDGVRLVNVSDGV